jgi:acyl-CoA thioesterase FadM
VWRAADATRERALAADGKVVCAVTDLARMVAIPIPERVRELVADLAEP